MHETSLKSTVKNWKHLKQYDIVNVLQNNNVVKSSTVIHVAVIIRALHRGKYF